MDSNVLLTMFIHGPYYPLVLGEPYLYVIYVLLQPDTQSFGHYTLDVSRLLS